MRTFLALTLLVLASLPAQAAQTCGGVDDACRLPDGRSYHLRLPDDWDGKSALPVLMHFHGWGRRGRLILNHGRIAGATRTRGVLLVAPNGQGRTWSFWSRDTDDISFADAVLADIAKRFPIRSDRIMVSGYSYGSAMAWRYACARGQRLFALLAVSGSFPDQSETCERPQRVAHVHGTRDTVMDFPFGAGGDVLGPVRLWRRTLSCPERSARDVWAARKILPFARYAWTCGEGRSLTLDVHERGHFIPRGWIAAQLDRLL